MITWLDTQTIHELGLEHARWLETMLLPWPGQVAEGRAELREREEEISVTKRQAPTKAELPLGDLPEMVALKLAYSPGRIHVRALDDVPIKGIVIGEGTCEPNQEETKVVFISARRGMVERLDGVGIVFDARPECLEVTPFTLPGEDVPSFIEPEVDLRPVRDATTDDWLRGEIEKYDTDPWQRVIACGLLLRYWSEGLDAVALESATTAYMNGVEPEAWRVIRDITSAWGQEVQNTIVDFAVSEIVRVRWELEELKEYRPAEPDWVARFVHLCVARDDLESVRELLGLLERHDINASLAALDDEAWSFVPTVPVGLDPENPRLLRALAREPHAWWTSPVEDPQWYDLFGKPEQKGT